MPSLTNEQPAYTLPDWVHVARPSDFEPGDILWSGGVGYRIERITPYEAGDDTDAARMLAERLRAGAPSACTATAATRQR